MFLSKRQQEVLAAQTMQARANMVPDQRLGISESALNSANTLIFKNALEAIQVLADPQVQQVMKGRMRKHGEDLWEATRSIRAYIKNL